MTPLLRRPRKPHPRPHDFRIHREEGLADRAQKGEVAFPVAAVEIIEKDPAGAARLPAMLDKEVVVAPRLEAVVARLVIGRARARQRRVKLRGRSSVRVNRGEVGAAAEPTLRGDDMACVHMHRRHQRRVHVRDERNTARPEARVICGPRDILAKLGGELAVDGRYVDPDFLEDCPTHDRDGPAAAAFTIPAPLLEAAGCLTHGVLQGVFVLDRLEHFANPVAQLTEPGLDPGATVAIGEKRGRNLTYSGGNSPVWRSASASAMAPARATLSDRAG